MRQNGKVVILGSARTPIGKLGGALSGVDAPGLGSAAIRGAMSRGGVAPGDVDYTVMGNVLPAGLGQAPARQAAIGAGIPPTTSALTVNKVCASGMMAAILGTQMIKAGDLEVAAVGGMESMSRAPHVLNGSREGKRFGNWEMVDTMVFDGLWCVFNDVPMGNLAESTASKFEISRDEQDRFSLSSHQKASKASTAGSFREEIVPIAVTSRNGSTEIAADEGPRADSSLEAIGGLKPAFPPGTTVTAGNSAQISDGAAALIVSSEARAKSLGIEPVARIDDYTFVANDPAELFEAPALAIDKLVRKGGLALADVDLLEVNEAFASQVVANGNVLEWDWDRVNVNGGAVALGHPIGATGARILVTLIHALRQRGLETGIAALCHGGGGAAAMRVSLV